MNFGNQFEAAMREFAQMGGVIAQDDEDIRLTIALVKRGNTVEFATAVCAPHDVPCEAVGMAVALQHFMEGKTVMLPSDRVSFL